MARRLAEDRTVSVCCWKRAAMMTYQVSPNPALWGTNLGGARDWAFQAEPNPNLNGRAMMLSIGKVLGGGSSINVMTWARGHKTDWDHFAAESGNDAWKHEAVLDIYRRIENWHGYGDSQQRGSDGLVCIEPSSSAHPAGPATIEAARCLGIARFGNPTATMMEGKGGAAIAENSIRDGKRQSIFRCYTYPVMDRPNLTVLSDASVRRVIINGRRATGVEVALRGEIRAFTAGTEVVLSLGAIHTPKVLMQSGVGDERSLRPMGIPVVQHLPGVGRNFQNHLAFTCVWETPDCWPPDEVASAVMYWPSSRGRDSPDFFACHGCVTAREPGEHRSIRDAYSCWTHAQRR